MNTEIRQLIKRIEQVNTGEPWFGRSVFEILEQADPKKVSLKHKSTDHSLLEILWHMNTWAGFTLKRIEKDTENDMAAFEQLDWRVIDPKIHTWDKGLKEFKSTQKKIISRLKKKKDPFLGETVDYRKYNFRFLINGMIEHNIYHLGQIAYLIKTLH